MYFTIGGSHPKLSLTELHFVIPDFAPIAHKDVMMVLETDEWDDQVLMRRLGGTVKLGEILCQMRLDRFTPEKVVQVLTKQKAPTEGARSLDFGWTVYGSKSAQSALKKFPIQIKKSLKAKGWSTRWVTGKGQQSLSPAAVAKCKLTQMPHADLCVLVDGDQVYVGRTTQVQDADAWSLRDYSRPFRDSANGMLPPKLARMMVNLAAVPDNGTVIDPFCGSGTVLMESLLATSAEKIIGSDIDPRFIEHTNQNLTWLVKEHIIKASDLSRCHVFASDVKDVQNHLDKQSLDAVVTEGWLGPPLQGNETSATLQQNAKNILALWEAALFALRPLLKSSARLVIVIPSFRTSRGHATVDLAARLVDLGYETISLPGLADEDSSQGLTYQRPDQFVARNLLLLKPITD